MFTLALLLFLQAGVPPQAQIVGPYTSREDQGQTTKVVLKNGLTAIVREEHATSLSNITIHVKAGYFNEDDRTRGISHLIESMLLKGTSRHPAADMTRQIRSMGASLTTYTDYDRTVFASVMPASSLPAALEMEADAVWHPLFDADELGRRIDVLLQEDKGRNDVPSSLASQRLYETAFSTHPLKQGKGFTAEALRALTREDLVAYHQKYYRPSNIILSIVAPIDREKVLEDVVRLFGTQENVSAEGDAARAETPQDVFRYAWRRGPIQQAHIAMGFHVPGILSDDARALEVLKAILGSGRSARLNQSLRDRKGLITSGSVQLLGFGDLGFFELDLQTASPIEAATATLAELESISRFGVSPEVVSRAKAMIADDYFRRQETVEGIGEALASYEALGDWKLSSTYLSAIQQVTPQRVVQVAEKYLKFGNLSVFEYLPESVERYLSPDEYRAAVLDKVQTTVERPNEKELPVVAQIPPRNEGLVAGTVGTIQRRSILRGPDVYILEDNRVPIVSFGIFFPGGRLLETDQNAGITELMLRSALRGTRDFDGNEIARRLENAGVRIQVVNEPDFFGYLLEGLAAKMDQALPVLVEILQNPLFEEAQVAGERSLQLTRIRNLRDDVEGFPFTLFMREVFGDLSYARQAIGTEAGIGKLTGTELRDWFRTNQRKILPTIVIVGDTRGTALVAPIADPLTNEDLEPRNVAGMPRFQPARQPGQLAESTGRQITNLIYGFSGTNRASDDRYALELFAAAVSGPGGRLAEMLQDKLGLAYTVRTANLSDVRGGAVFTFAGFLPNKEPELRAALDGEYSRLRSNGLTAEELEATIPFTIGIRDRALQTRDARVMEYARAVISGAGVQSVGRYESSLRGVTMEQVKAVMEQYLAPDGLRIGIARGGTAQ